MRLDFLLQRDVRRSTDDGIQLITAQKAKGSEWQAVILPFLGRAVLQPSPRYPCIIKIPGSSDSLVALTKDDFFEEVRSATKTAAQQEMARLLYVATTRARHTLVLALDEEIFARPNGELQNGAQLKCLLGEKQINRPHFEILGVEPTACSQTIRTEEQLAVSPGSDLPPPPQITGDDLKLAKDRAACFVRKFNPSDYGEEIDRGVTDDIYGRASSIIVARSGADTPATLYGRWWHDFVQGISWHNEASWKQTFDEHQAISPVPNRSAAEWELFLQCLKEESDFAELLARAELVAHSEMPLFWRVDEQNCMEGVVDLGLFHPLEKRWFILDWKTNRLERGGITKLRVSYRPQISAYWKAVTEMTKQPVRAGIYSTAIGQLIVYDEKELATEWERLRRLSQDELVSEIKEERFMAVRL
jgi:ATP-dependent exoDNAse (exonuclease V) beta subunit